MIDFPASPTDGQVFSAPNGIVYTYSVANSAWLTSVVPGGVAGGVLSGTYPNPGHVAGIGAPLQLYSEQVLAATANAMQVNFGATAKLVEVWFDLTLNPATNAGIFLKATQAGVPNTGSVYSTGTANMYQPNTFAAIQGTSAFVTLITSGTQARGVMRLTKPANFIGHGHHYALDASANFYNQQIALTTGLTGVDGVQVTTSGTFAVGSYLRCLVLP